MTGLEEITLPDGTVRRMGNIEPPQGLTRSWKLYGDARDTPMVPRSKWKDLIGVETGPEFPFLPPLKDQDGEGQCNAVTTTQMAESCRMNQGLPHVDLSAGDLYGRINGGVDRGSMLEDAMAKMMEEGVGTVATCGGTLWKQRLKKPPAGERRRFRFLEVFLCPTFDHCMSAVLCGFRLNTGIMWPNATPDADGWLPPRRAGGGHAIFGYKGTFRGDEFGIWHQNSWGDWGPLRGLFVIPERAYGRAIGGWFAVRSVTDEGGILPPLQP